MTTIKKRAKAENKHFKFEDLNLGGVFIDQDGDLMMKVGYLVDYKPKYYVMCLENFELYDDVENYDIVELVDTEIFIG